MGLKRPGEKANSAQSDARLLNYSQPTQLMCIEYFWRTDAIMSYFIPAWYEVCKDSSVAETQAFSEFSDIHQFK